MEGGRTGTVRTELEMGETSLVPNNLTFSPLCLCLFSHLSSCHPFSPYTKNSFLSFPSSPLNKNSLISSPLYLSCLPSFAPFPIPQLGCRQSFVGLHTLCCACCLPAALEFGIACVPALPVHCLRQTDLLLWEDGGWLGVALLYITLPHSPTLLQG